LIARFAGRVGNDGSCRRWVCLRASFAETKGGSSPHRFRLRRICGLVRHAITKAFQAFADPLVMEPAFPDHINTAVLGTTFSPYSSALSPNRIAPGKDEAFRTGILRCIVGISCYLTLTRRHPVMKGKNEALARLLRQPASFVANPFRLCCNTNVITHNGDLARH